MALSSEKQSADIFILIRWQYNKMISQLKVHNTAKQSLSIRCVLTYPRIKDDVFLRAQTDGSAQL